MLCNECGKNNASVHVTKIYNGVKTEYHLCEECAKKQQSLFNTSFSMENLFNGMLNDAFGTVHTSRSGCATCGMTFDEFRDLGKFGCTDCIATFKPRLMPVIKNIQGYDTHVGKIPRKAGGKLKIEKDLDMLKSQLKTYVEQEEYEKAAEIRDKIRDMENKNQENK